MDKKQKIIIAVVLGAVVLYLLLKNKGVASTTATTDKYANDSMLSALGAGSTFTSSVTVTDNMSATEKAEAQAKIEEEKAAYEQLKQLQAQYLTLTGKSGVGLTIQQLQTLIADHQDKTNLLNEYIKISGNSSANLNDENFDTAAEILAAIEKSKAQQKLEYEQAINNLSVYTEKSTAQLKSEAADLIEAANLLSSYKSKETSWTTRKPEIERVVKNLRDNLQNYGTAFNNKPFDRGVLVEVTNYNSVEACYANRYFGELGGVKTPGTYGGSKVHRSTIQSAANTGGNTTSYRANNSAAVACAKKYGEHAAKGNLSKRINKFGEFVS